MREDARHPMNSNEMDLEDMLSPNRVRQREKISFDNGTGTVLAHFETVSSKGLIRICWISDNVRPSDVPDGS
jgi:hypothetical protein